MTKYEIDRIQNAIRHIQTAVDVDPWAVQIAVEAMRKQIPQKTQKNLQPTCNQLATDCISRQAAIDAILAVTGNSSVRELYEHVQEHGLSDMWSGGVNAAIDIIIAVPSAQPKKRTETHGVCLDAIDRQAAIDAHYEYCNKHPDAGFPVWSLKILEDLPSAQPERQKGEWIDYTEDGYVECPFCHSATNCDGNKDELHFCFSCGADMRKDGEVEEPKKCDTCKHEKERWFSRCSDCSDYELWEEKE